VAWILVVFCATSTDLFKFFWEQDAKALWERIQERQGVNKWRPDLEEEYEDLEGNVYNKKTYSDLQRQGLI
jgi:splicing factor 3A subunit 3